MSTDKLIPEYAPPTYSGSQQPRYQQPGPNAYANAPPPPYQGTVTPEYPHQPPVHGTTRTVIVTERTVPTTQVYLTPPIRQVVVNPFLWIYVIIAILFCPILGCIALCFLIMASSDQENGRYAEALTNARVARIFAGFGIALSCIIIGINIVLNFTVYQHY
ncbi:hypothetical protein LOD99_9718 [Oopsacas minuta]|uniref:Uncharacterized protein n=1 Tax=Oopsacas minuta TaxID=111878 RepID=A0AAV7KM61_9METZ|nr:hypothetical protein LOD99_9718 [Oopsacas minuta]